MTASYRKQTNVRSVPVMLNQVKHVNQVNKHLFVVSQQECCVEDFIHVFQIAELCLFFALAEETCCTGAGVLNNSGWTGESSWKKAEVRTEHSRKKIVQLSYQSSRVWWMKSIKYIRDYREPACNSRAAENGRLIPGSGRSLEEGMATHSSILAWRIPG